MGVLAGRLDLGARLPHHLPQDRLIGGLPMGRLINTTSMTVDGVIDVSDWFVAEGDHDDASRALFEGDAVMLVGRKSYEGFAGFWPTQTGPWADLINPMPKYVASRSTLGPLEWNATAIEGD